MLRPVARILPVVATLAFSLSSWGKVYLNSACHLEPGKAISDITGDKNKSEKYPLASISKIVTSLWALKTLGADYTFDTRFNITANDDKTVDVHIQGSRNPYFGKRIGYLLISELNKLGIKKINKLTFDNNFLLSWNVETEAVAAGDTKVYSNIADQAADVKKYLEGALLTPVNKSDYATLRKQAASDLKLDMVESPELTADSVEFVAASEYKMPANTKAFTMSSTALKNILKKMNNQSNNYIADHLYWNLGGTPKFNEFVEQLFAQMKDEVVFENGSGNNFGTDEKPGYNQASCEFMVNAMVELQKTAEASKLKLSDIMAVAGMDSDSTVKNWGGTAEDAAIVKTGSVYKAKTLAGALSTKSGIVHFAILYHTDRDANASDWVKANALIKEDVQKLIEDNKGRKALNYDELRIYPFSKNSTLKQFVAPLADTAKKTEKAKEEKKSETNKLSAKLS